MSALEGVLLHDYKPLCKTLSILNDDDDDDDAVRFLLMEAKMFL